MLEDFSYEGIWWLPNNPEDKITGNLKFKSGNGIVLKLTGVFGCRKGVVLKPEIILGTTTTNEKITLFETIETHWGQSDSLGNSIFVCNQVFVGEHFSKREEIKFHSISINFTYLEQWLSSKSVFGVEFGEDEDIVTFKHPKKYLINIDSINSTFSTGYSFGFGRESWTNVNLDHSSYLKITPNDVKDLGWYTKIVFNLGNLLTLLIGVPIYTKSLIAEGDEMQQLKEAGFSNKVKIKIYSILPEPRIYPELFLWNMRSRFPKLISYQGKDYFSIIVNDWFDKQDVLHPVYEIFSRTNYNPSMYPHVDFLSLLQAIEAFHRRVYGGKYLSDEEYEPIREKLVNVIPASIEDGFRDSLKNKIKYGNEISLRKRLLDFSRVKPVPWFEYIFKNNDEKTIKIVDKIVNTRNYLTHYDSESKGKILEHDELIRTNEKLKLFLAILLLEQVRAPTEVLFNIVHALNKAEDYREAIRSQE